MPLTSCPFYANADPDYCDSLSWGKCRMMGQACPLVRRDGPTQTQWINDVITFLAAPFVRWLAGKSKGGKP